MSTLLALLDHLIWADARAYAAVGSIDPARAERAQAVRLYAHSAAAAHVWLARLEGRQPTHPVWPDLSLEAAAALAAESLAGLSAIASGEARALEREIDYRNSSGHALRNTIADILTHVTLHGTYHRGQIALLARQGGGTPAATDYIVFVRGVPAPVAPSAAAEASPA